MDVSPAYQGREQSRHELTGDIGSTSLMGAAADALEGCCRDRRAREVPGPASGENIGWHLETGTDRHQSENPTVIHQAMATPPACKTEAGVLGVIPEPGSKSS
jgi:hypothetical protein